jgi:hypothetical protein
VNLVVVARVVAQVWSLTGVVIMEDWFKATLRCSRSPQVVDAVGVSVPPFGSVEVLPGFESTFPVAAPTGQASFGCELPSSDRSRCSGDKSFLTFSTGSPASEVKSTLCSSSSSSSPSRPSLPVVEGVLKVK